MPVRLLRLPSATLRVREEGRAEKTLVVATDPPNVLEHYDALVEAFAPRRRVVVFEPPGFGFSSPPHGAPLGLESMVRVTRELIAAVEAEPATLLFPCVGAYAAILVAARHPALVEALVLPQAPAWTQEMAWLDRVDRRRLLRAPLLGPLLVRSRRRDLARRWYEAALPPGADARPFVEPALRAFDRGAAFPLAEAFRAMEREGEPRLLGATQPALLLWGDADRTHRPSDPVSLREVLPHADALTLPGCGHFPELEAPRRVADETLRWLARKGL